MYIWGNLIPSSICFLMEMIICMIFRASIVPAASKSLPHITTTLKGIYNYPLPYKWVQEVKIKELGPNHTANKWYSQLRSQL